ncbi:hypothetical protein PR202_gb10773 [Eleusine coracana subsp. coracana]|uniref:Methyltransferase n=1 Tax=Eleusine coracana subsp. coracana TaxID=191504 RepID=A0AAV5EKD0_ELECO|nr:hypothetical protein PR202_gb10773 [Eleusine coracana subsp. coracana]
MEMEPEKEAELPVPEENGDNGGKAPSEEDEEKAPALESEEEPNEGDFEEDDPEAAKRKAAAKRARKLPPLFSSSAHYHWKQCSAKSGHHFVPCVDFDGDGSQRHHERSCPRSPVTCLVSLPKEYKPPAPWPERKDKVWYESVGHPRLSSYVKGHNWLNHTGEYLVFSPDEWEFKGGARHYVESIDEMAPDVDWGKNIRIMLDIGCKSAGFGVALLEKDVITLSLGLTNDQADLAQVALERGIPATIGSLGSHRLPFPSGAFDAIHCGECNIPWHANGGKLLLEMNRILRPGGYFIISSKSTDLESEEGISASMTALCWNSIAYNSDDVSEVGVKIFQRPATNEEYDMRAKKDPPFCKENQNKATAWYTRIKHCLHKAPVGIEERGSDWPEEWLKRLQTFPEWLGDLETRVAADHNHWKAVVEKSYLDGLGLNWSNIRNVMDMRAVYGGFAAALASKSVWVMNVVPVHAADTLPIIYERGVSNLLQLWLRWTGFLRPGGWAIIRDRLEILDPLETILKSLHWEIVMTFRKDKEGIIIEGDQLWDQRNDFLDSGKISARYNIVCCCFPQQGPKQKRPKPPKPKARIGNLPTSASASAPPPRCLPSRRRPPPPPPPISPSSSSSPLPLLFFLYKSLRLRRERSSAPARAPTATPTLLYASVTGTSKALATRLSTRLTTDAGVPIRAT